MTSKVTKAINNKHVPAESITLLCSLEAKTVSVTRSYCFPFFFACFSSSAVHWALRATIDNPRVTETEKYTKTGSGWEGGKLQNEMKWRDFTKKQPWEANLGAKKKKKSDRKVCIYIGWNERRESLIWRTLVSTAPPPSTVKCSCQGNSGTISICILPERERESASTILPFAVLWKPR